LGAKRTAIPSFSDRITIPSTLILLFTDSPTGRKRVMERLVSIGKGFSAKKKAPFEETSRVYNSRISSLSLSL